MRTRLRIDGAATPAGGLSRLPAVVGILAGRASASCRARRRGRARRHALRPGPHRSGHPAGRHHDQRAGGHRRRNRDQHRRPTGPRRDGPPRTRRRRCTTSAGLRTNLDGDTDQYEAVADFLTVAPELQRGQKAAFTLSAPLRSLTKHSLAIGEPGVYPLLVNVNGTPDYGEPARLDNARFLLPVVGVPPDPLDTSGRALAPWALSIAPDTSKPVPVTMLWPLADRPRLAPGVPGGTIPVRLIDDELATSLATGGRLDILLAAAEFATSRDVDPDGAISRSLCLAVDPDLLVTVNAMTGGYVVSDSPDGAAPTAGHPDPPGDRAGRGGELAEPVARTGSPDVRRAAALCPSRPRRRATRRRCRAQRDRHQRRRRHRRPDPGRHRGPRRHPDPRWLADPPHRGSAQRQRQHRRDRRRRLLRRRLHHRHTGDRRTPHRGGCHRRWWSRRSTPPSAPPSRRPAPIRSRRPI